MEPGCFLPAKTQDKCGVRSKGWWDVGVVSLLNVISFDHVHYLKEVKNRFSVFIEIENCFQNFSILFGSCFLFLIFKNKEK